MEIEDGELEKKKKKEIEQDMKLEEEELEELKDELEQDKNLRHNVNLIKDPNVQID